MLSCLFFKQKTAYDVRISDWSSDVCSSDLDPVEDGNRPRARVAIGAQPFVHIARSGVVGGDGERVAAAIIAEHLPEIGRPQGQVVIGVAGQRGGIVAEAELARDLARGAGHQLHHAARAGVADRLPVERSEEHTSELQSLLRISYAV